uniref:Reverse transcriptase domain-containing protein n=1 Tax=Amphimedon queenslandica TaxID=400682 RepID=A0A1X7US55_AMPQE
METLLCDIPGVVVYIDDILVSGRDTDEHYNNLDKVMKRLEEAGVQLKQSKYSIGKSSVEYLGHIIDKDGLHPAPEKVKAVKMAPEPRNITELRAFLGYYKQRSSGHRAGINLRLSEKPSRYFNHLHFSYILTVIKRLWCRVMHLLMVWGSTGMEDGSERPIAYASRTLSSAERNYSQLEKEGLAIIFAVRKFHQYLFGCKFIIYSDHKPLKYLFSVHHQVPVMAAARIQRWSLLLSSYQYEIQYRPGKSMSNADALSRLPTSETSSMSTPQCGEVTLLLNHLSTSIITAKHIRN